MRSRRNPDAVADQITRTAAQDRSLAPWVRDHRPEIAAAVQQADSPATTAKLVDAADHQYRVVYMTAVTSLDGRGPVIPSNSPVNFRTLPTYPPQFQARDLSEAGERTKIDVMARGLDPIRLLSPHLDPTLGAPIVWISPDARMFVLAGNGRTLAILRAPEDVYAQYLREGRRIWPTLDWTAGPAGFRTMLVRAVFQPDGQALSMSAATQLAGASQASTAAEESPFGRALSTVRGLGLSFAGLPAVEWTDTITAENLRDFTDRNRAFVNAVLARLPKHKAPAYMNSADKLAELLSQIFISAIPARVMEIGLSDRHEQTAVIAALPTLITLHEAIRRGTVKPGWDLLPRLGLAFEAAQALVKRRMSVEAAVTALEQEGRQGRIADARTIFSDLDPMGLIFAIAIKKAAARTAPDRAIIEYLQPFAAAALNDAPGQGMLLGGASDPVQILAMAVDRKRLGARFRNNPVREYVPTHNLSADALALLRMLDDGHTPLLRYQPTPPPVLELLRLRLAVFREVARAVQPNMGRLEFTQHGKSWWRREVNREIAANLTRRHALF